MMPNLPIPYTSNTIDWWSRDTENKAKETNWGKGILIRIFGVSDPLFAVKKSSFTYDLL
jgi:hypothetical protein